MLWRAILTSAIRTVGNNLRIHALEIVLVVTVFLFVNAYSFSANLHGDGLNHAVVAKGIAETGNLLTSDPYRIANVQEGRILSYPISYSQFSYVIIAIPYILAGEMGLRIFSSVMAVFTSIFAYALLRNYNRNMAFLGSYLLILLCSMRFISMTPLMEQILVPFAVASIYCYQRLSATKRWRYACLLGVFLGASFVTKQQGVLFSLVTLVAISAFAVRDFWNKKNIELLRILLLTILIFAVIVAVPSVEQIERNGTLDYSPSTTVRIPFMYPKYFVSPEASENLTKWLGSQYWYVYSSPLEALNAFLLYPALHYQAVRSFDVSLTVLFGTIFIAGTLCLLRFDSRLGVILLVTFSAEVLTLFLTNTPIQNYHLIGISVLALVITFGIYFLTNLMSSRRILRYAFSIAITVILITGFSVYVHDPIFGKSGRIDDLHKQSLENLRVFIEEEVPGDAIILGPGGVYRYWIERNFVWMSDMGGAMVPELLESTDETRSLEILLHYDVDFVFIDNNQTRRKGLGDYMPSVGLFTLVDDSSHFKRLYDDGIVRFYEIIY